MANFGSNSASTAEESFAGDTGPIFSCGILPTGGVLTGFFAFIGGNSTFGSAQRWAVYQGGVSDTDATGAVRIWRSGNLNTGNVNARSWKGAATDFGETMSGVLTASRTFLVIKSNSGSVGLSNADRGDLSNLAKIAAFSNDAAIDFPATMPSAGSGSSEAIKAYITYTAAAAAPPPLWKKPVHFVNDELILM